MWLTRSQQVLSPADSVAGPHFSKEKPEGVMAPDGGPSSVEVGKMEKCFWRNSCSLLLSTVASLALGVSIFTARAHEGHVWRPAAHL